MALYIVQFTHPGPEHTLSPIERKNGIKEWNSGSHKRKFMIAEGQIVLNNPAALSDRQKLMFWGEWEPTSQIIQTFRSGNPKILSIILSRLEQKSANLSLQFHNIIQTNIFFNFLTHSKI